MNFAPQMVRNFIIRVVIYLCFLSIISGQNTLDFPKLFPSSYTAYDIDQGLPISCVEKLFVDSKGRLFINPCKYQDIYNMPNFYQYDGNKSWFIPIKSSDDTTGFQDWNFIGSTQNGLIFGKDVGSTKCFLYNYESGILKSIEFDPKESIQNMVAGKSDDIFALTKERKGFNLYQINVESKKLLFHIEFNSHRSLSPVYPIPLIFLSDRVYFLLEDEGFVSYMLSNKTIKRYSWNELLGKELRKSDPEESMYEFIAPNLTIVPGGNLLFYLRSYEGFFIFDPERSCMSKHTQLSLYLNKFINHHYIKVEFYRDSVQNTLINIAGYPNTEQKNYFGLLGSILWDQNNQFYDYKRVTEKESSGRYGKSQGSFLYSYNFKNNVLMATGGGIIGVEVKSNLPIKSAIREFACRSITELNKAELLITSESGNKAFLELSNLNSRILKCRINDNTWCRVTNFPQFISRDQLIWAPINGGTLTAYNKTNKTFRYYKVGMEFEKFAFTSDHEIALINSNNELYRFNLDLQTTTPYTHHGSPLNIGGTANEMFVDQFQILWIASLNGLWRINPKTGDIRHLSQKDGLADNRIMCIYESSQRELCLGTLGGGLQFYNPQTGQMRLLNKITGLTNNSVVGILEDKDKDLWIATFEGISVVSPQGKILFAISEEDGLAHKEFNRYSYLKTSDGRLVFGGVAGLSILEPQELKSYFLSTNPFSIYLTGITYHHTSENSKMQLNTGSDFLIPIILPASHRFIKLNFGVSDYVQPEKNKFSYRFDYGNDDVTTQNNNDRWTDIGSNTELVLNDLTPGDYSIIVRAVNSKGQFTSSPLVIPIIVEEYFYKSWWFYILCSIPIIGAVFWWIRRLQTEQLRLEVEVAMRTKQILKDKELIEEQSVKLKEMDEIKSRFFTNISHEFRTPLTVITGMATQIKKQPTQWMEKGIELIQRNSNQLLNLINQILDLRKLESGAQKANYVLGNIIPYLKYLSVSFGPLAQSKNIQIHFYCTIEELEMDYDPDKILTILSNLISNAIKHTEGPGDIHVRVIHNTGSEEEKLIIKVEDTGHGIGPEALPYIFDQFYQVPDLATQKPHGSGIGLALTQELVKLLNGSISVHSKKGQGTSFHLSLPVTRKSTLQTKSHSVPVNPYNVKSDNVVLENIEIKKTPTENLIDDSENVDSESQLEHFPLLLIVEDNADVRFYLKTCLEGAYRLISAENGQEGIDIAIDQVPDIIISDVMMPVKDGFALCETLKNDERTSHIPIILLTAKADFESKISGLRKGADAYLTKPFEQEELLVRIEQLFQLRKKLRERYQHASHENPITSLNQEQFILEDEFIQKLRKLVLDNIESEDFGIVQLCRGLNVSRTQLHNKIKALTGQSTSEFVRMVRLHRARKLIQTTDKNISEVAYEVGISNPAYFSRIYTEAFGESPKNTRKG